MYYDGTVIMECLIVEEQGRTSRMYHEQNQHVISVEMTRTNESGLRFHHVNPDVKY